MFKFIGDRWDLIKQAYKGDWRGWVPLAVGYTFGFFLLVWSYYLATATYDWTEIVEFYHRHGKRPYILAEAFYFQSIGKTFIPNEIMFQSRPEFSGLDTILLRAYKWSAWLLMNSFTVDWDTYVVLLTEVYVQRNGPGAFIPFSQKVSFISELATTFATQYSKAQKLDRLSILGVWGLEPMIFLSLVVINLFMLLLSTYHVVWAILAGYVVPKFVIWKPFSWLWCLLLYLFWHFQKLILGWNRWDELDIKGRLQRKVTDWWFTTSIFGYFQEKYSNSVSCVPLIRIFSILQVVYIYGFWFASSWGFLAINPVSRWEVLGCKEIPFYADWSLCFGIFSIPYSCLLSSLYGDRYHRAHFFKTGCQLAIKFFWVILLHHNLLFMLPALFYFIYSAIEVFIENSESVYGGDSFPLMPRPLAKRLLMRAWEWSAWICCLWVLFVLGTIGSTDYEVMTTTFYKLTREEQWIFYVLGSSMWVPLTPMWGDNAQISASFIRLPYRFPRRLEPVYFSFPQLCIWNGAICLSSFFLFSHCCLVFIDLSKTPIDTGLTCSFIIVLSLIFGPKYLDENYEEEWVSEFPEDFAERTVILPLLIGIGVPAQLAILYVFFHLFAILNKYANLQGWAGWHSSVDTMYKVNSAYSNVEPAFDEVSPVRKRYRRGDGFYKKAPGGLSDTDKY